MKSSKRSQVESTHRVYLNPRGGHLLRCEAVGTEQLAALAEETDRVVIHQVGPNRIPASEVSRVQSLLETLQWPHRHRMTNPTTFRRIFVGKIGDRCARLRLKTGRHFLAGVVERRFEGISSRYLILVLASNSVQSCDIQLAE